MDRTASEQLRLVEGGALRSGDRVLVEGRPATVVCASFRTHVFRGQVSVLFDSGERELLPAEKVLRSPPGRSRHVPPPP